MFLKSPFDNNVIHNEKHNQMTKLNALKVVKFTHIIVSFRSLNLFHSKKHTEPMTITKDKNKTNVTLHNKGAVKLQK